MRYLLAIIIVAMLCAPAVSANLKYYVNPSNPLARNVADTSPDYNWGQSETYPYISPSYAITQMAGGTVGAHDTMYVYALTDTYYPDVMNFAQKYIDVVGISVGDDSPTWSCVTNYFWNIADIPTTAGNFIYDGVRWTNCSKYTSLLRYGTGDSFVWFRNCIFDNTREPTAGGSGFITLVPVTGAGAKVNFDNCVFAHIGTPLVYINNSGAADSMAIRMTNVTVVGCSYPVLYFGAAGENKNCITFRDCIISADSWISFYNTTCTTTIDVSYSDTYGTNFVRNTGFGVAGTVKFVYNNVISADPQFKYATSDSRSIYGYIQNPTLSTASSTGGLIGVLWGGTYIVPSTTTLVYRAPFAMRYRRLLWR